MHTAIITEHQLSDRSKVYSVHLGSIEINAVSRADAEALADKIVAAIDEHSVDEATVSDRTP